jgi:ubiquinone/menaquinone biosynthesis C-methylase UbiE
MVSKEEFPDNQTIYNSNWAKWESMKRFGPMSRHTQRMVLSICSKMQFESVLDVGCGPGVFLERLNSAFPGKLMAGIDISSSAVEIARRKLPFASFNEIDISSSVPSGKWDLVTMIDVAEHIDNDIAVFRNVRTVCNRYLLIVTLEGKMRDFEPSIGHVRNYRAGELREKLIQTGYTIQQYRHWGWPMFSPFYRNLSKGIDAHNTDMTSTRRFLGGLAYWGLFCNWPGRGDLIIVVATPEKRRNSHETD